MRPRELMDTTEYKWKDIPGSSHQILLTRVLELGFDLKVLDLGAGRGELGRRIRSNCQLLVGIENNSVTAEIARPFYDDLIVGNVMEVRPTWAQSFDLIILGDILEHLAEPENCLKVIQLYLNDTGRILVSVPNVANITVRLGLLFGRFNYQPKGIMDRSHLHFYTLETARKQIEQAGYVITKTKATPMPIELGLPWLARTPMLASIRLSIQFLAQIFPKLFGYQFVFEAMSNHIE